VTVVVDASALVVAVVEAGERGGRARELLAGGASAPHLVDAEVGQSLRGLVLRGALEPEAAWRSLGYAGDLVQERFEHRPLQRLAWSWRANVSFYDGMYAALASLLDLPLLTVDARMAAALEGLVDVQTL
jgi:predicted nucleic acid-binding protein